MTRARSCAFALIVATFGLPSSPITPWGMSAAQAQAQAPTEILRPEIAKPVLAAQELLKAKKFKEALAKLQEVDAVPNQTPNEVYVLDRVRASIAAGSGDDELTTQLFERIIASGRLTPDESIKFVQAIGGLYYKQKNYAQAVSWYTRYTKDGGTDPAARDLLIRSYYLNNEFARAAEMLRADLQTDEKAGKTPTEEQLRLLASCALKQNDQVAYVDALELFVIYYPKREYWVDLLYRVQAKPAFAGRLLLDVYRLKLALGQMNSATEFMEMAQLALQTGFPAEAKSVVEQGYQSGVLGTGAEISRQNRLREMVNKSAADDLKTIAQGEGEAIKAKNGNGLMNLGYAYVTSGQADKGIDLMEQGMRHGGMKRMEDAKLHLATAYAMTDRKENAIQMFKSVQGADGTADLARLWLLQLEHSAK